MRNLLYHGVNKKMDKENQGKVCSSGELTLVIPIADGSIKADGRFIAGNTEHNAVRAKHLDENPYFVKAISTSTIKKVAEKFATYGNTEDGFVYVIDREKLVSLGIRAIELPNPLHANEHEVTLLLGSYNALPDEVIVEKYEVKSTWNF